MLKQPGPEVAMQHLRVLFSLAWTTCYNLCLLLAPNSRGQDGAVSGSLIQSGTLDAVGKRTFPKELLVIMRRQAEDLLLENSNNKKGKDALKFVLSLTDGRGDVDQIKKCEIFII